MNISSRSDAVFDFMLSPDFQNSAALMFGEQAFRQFQTLKDFAFSC